MKDDITLALEQLSASQAARREASIDYKLAIDTCAELGITNVQMARVAGVSETAIRMMRKRMEFEDI